MTMSDQRRTDHDPTRERTPTRQTPAAQARQAPGQPTGHQAPEPGAAVRQDPRGLPPQAPGPAGQAPRPAQGGQAPLPPPPPPQEDKQSLGQRLTSMMPKARTAHPGDGSGQPGSGQPGSGQPSQAAPGPTRGAAPASSGEPAPPRRVSRAARVRKAAAVQPQPAARPTRRARLRLTRVDPWSVMKTAFLLSIAFGVVTVVAVLMVWSALSFAGVWDSINATVRSVLGDDSAANFDVENYVGTTRVLGFTLVVAVVDVLLLTAIATLAAFLYNLSAALLGGVEVTLAEEDR